MNTRDQLNQYLQGLEKRMRWLAVSKGAAVAAGVALGATLALVLITNALAFSATSMTVARVVLFVALAAAVGFALVIPLMHLTAAKRLAARKRPSLNFRNACSLMWSAARSAIPCWTCSPWIP